MKPFFLNDQNVTISNFAKILKGRHLMRHNSTGLKFQLRFVNLQSLLRSLLKNMSKMPISDPNK